MGNETLQPSLPGQTDKDLLHLPAPEGLPQTLDDFCARLNGMLTLPAAGYQTQIETAPCGCNISLRVFPEEVTEPDWHYAPLEIRYESPKPHFPGRYAIVRQFNTAEGMVRAVAEYPWRDPNDPRSAIDTTHILRYAIANFGRFAKGNLNTGLGTTLNVEFTGDGKREISLNDHRTSSSTPYNPARHRMKFGILLRSFMEKSIDPAAMAAAMLALPKSNETIDIFKQKVFPRFTKNI